MGLRPRDFERRFRLADFVEVRDAAFEDGLLQIDLVRELPEAMKSKRIEIRSGKATQDSPTKTKLAANYVRSIHLASTRLWLCANESRP